MIAVSEAECGNGRVCVVPEAYVEFAVVNL